MNTFSHSISSLSTHRILAICGCEKYVRVRETLNPQEFTSIDGFLPLPPSLSSSLRVLSLLRNTSARPCPGEIFKGVCVGRRHVFPRFACGLLVRFDAGGAKNAPRCCLSYELKTFLLALHPSSEFSCTDGTLVTIPNCMMRVRMSALFRERVGFPYNLSLGAMQCKRGCR